MGPQCAVNGNQPFRRLHRFPSDHETRTSYRRRLGLRRSPQNRKATVCQDYDGFSPVVVRKALCSAVIQQVLTFRLSQQDNPVREFATIRCWKTAAYSQGTLSMSTLFFLMNAYRLC